jgi:hypothetical protein
MISSSFDHAVHDMAHTMPFLSPFFSIVHDRVSHLPLTLLDTPVLAINEGEPHTRQHEDAQ